MAIFEEPKKQHIHFQRNEGSYNWLNPSEVSAQYVFRFPHLSPEEMKALELQPSFLIAIDKDYGFSPKSYTALELAHELKEIIDSYWINSDQAPIKKLVEYLESVEEEQEELRNQYEIDYAQAKLNYWTDRVNYLTKSN